MLIKRAACREVLVALGDPDDRMLVVKRGLLGLKMENSRSARPYWLDLLGSGSTFGETALVGDQTPQRLTLVALIPSHVVEVRMGDLTEDELTRLAPSAIASMARKVHRRGERVLNLRNLSARARIAACLCDLAELVGEPHGPRSTRFERTILTQQDIADYVGCARDAVNKTLASFSNEGWIERSATHVTLVDPPALRSLSQAGYRSRHDIDVKSVEASDFANELLNLAEERLEGSLATAGRGAA